jgi:hypothetical protein
MPPKQKKKSSRHEFADGFDDMLAKFKAADLASIPPRHASQSAADDTPANAAKAQTPKVIRVGCGGGIDKEFDFLRIHYVRPMDWVVFL